MWREEWRNYVEGLWGRCGVIVWGRGEEWGNWMMGEEWSNWMMGGRSGGMMGEEWSYCLGKREEWSDCVEG